MQLDEITISRAIIESYSRKLMDALDVDVAIVGGGPAGLICGYYLAEAKRKVVLIERKLSIGGGMWGGGIMFNEIVVQKQAKRLLDCLGIRTKEYRGYYVADSVETVTTLCSYAAKAGLKIFNLMSVEDVMVRNKRVAGLVLNWSAVEMAKLHVDPIVIRARFVVDASGHPAEVVRIIEKKTGIVLNTKTGKHIGERSMNAHAAEALTLINSKQVCPGLYVAGMCANATFGGPRMGPIFGGMLLSGEKVARELIKKLTK